MAEHGIVLVPTLSTFHDLAERFTSSFAAPLVEQAKRQRDEAYSTLVAARQAGVTLAMGHDSGPPGDNAIELVRMVYGGLTALEGIAAATQGSAAALGLDDVGTVTAGAGADLLVLDGDPLAGHSRAQRLQTRLAGDPAGRIVAGRGRVTMQGVIEDGPFRPGVRAAVGARRPGDSRRAWSRTARRWSCSSPRSARRAR